MLKNLFKPNDWYPVWSKTYSLEIPERKITGWQGEPIVVESAHTLKYTNQILYSPSRSEYKLEAFEHRDGYDETVEKLNEFIQGQ